MARGLKHTNKASQFALLVEYYMAGILVCHRNYLGHSDLLHYSVPLYNFVEEDHFINLGENTTCPAGGISM